MKTNQMADIVRDLKKNLNNFNDYTSLSVLTLKDSNFIHQRIVYD